MSQKLPSFCRLIPVVGTAAPLLGLLAALAGCDTARAPAASERGPAARAAASETAVEAGEKQVTNSTGTPAEDTAATSQAVTPAAASEVTASGPLNITFDTIKFPLEKNADYKRSMITPEIEKLHGRSVKLRGFILPSFQQSGLTQFVLVRDNMECCFGPGAALYDCVVVEMKPGKSTDYTVRPVAVEGTFEIRDFLDPEGNPLAIYHLDGESVGF